MAVVEEEVDEWAGASVRDRDAFFSVGVDADRDAQEGCSCLDGNGGCTSLGLAKRGTDGGERFRGTPR